MKFQNIEYKKNIIITGEKSFFGRNFIKIAKKKKLKILVYRKIKNKKKLKNIKCLIHFSFKKLLNKSPSFFFKKNISEILDLINFCNKKKIKLIFISSASYAPSNKKSKEDDDMFSYNMYSMAKILCEKYIKKKAKEYMIIRATNIYGKNGHSFIEDLVKLSKTKCKIINENKNLIRDFIYINDICEILLKLTAVKKSKLILNVGSGKPTKIIDIYKFLRSKKLIQRMIFKNTLYTPPRNFFVADISRLKKYININFNRNIHEYLINELSN